MKTNLIIILAVVAILVVGAATYFLIQQLRNNDFGNGVVCTADAKLCPDGSYVGRNPNNNCEFNACPSSGSSGTFPEGTAPQTHEINIQNFAFSPSELTIQVGDTVIWTNLDSVSHTITSNNGDELDSQIFSKGETFSHTFSTVGNFPYHCALHPSMKGTISVE